MAPFVLPRPDQLQAWIDSTKEPGGGIEVYDSYLVRDCLRVVSFYDPASEANAGVVGGSDSRRDSTPRPPSITFCFTVPQNLINGGGNLHGGAIATIFDLTTSLALGAIARPGVFQLGGVSRTLSVTYLKASQIGDEVEVTAEVVSAGKRLSHLRGVMRRKSDGSIIATAEHGKVNTDPEAGGKL